MPGWLGTAIAALIVIGGGILTYLIKIERALGSIIATAVAQQRDIDDLKSFRLNIEQARALIPHERRRRTGDIP